MKKLPDPRSGAHKLLRQLAAAPGTFYQICERAEIDIEDDRAERIQREIINSLIEGGHAHLVGVVYSITSAARAALAPPAPNAGQVAGPAYRGTYHPAQVRIVRRAAGARA